MSLDDTAFWLRILNLGFSVFVFVVCMTKILWTKSDSVRKARLMGLGLLAASLAIGSYELRYNPLNLRTPIATVGIILAAYGMMRTSTIPDVFKSKIKS